MLEIFTRLTALKTTHSALKSSDPASLSALHAAASASKGEYGPSAPLLRIYSGHDTGPMINSLTTLGVYDQVHYWYVPISPLAPTYFPRVLFVVIQFRLCLDHMMTILLFCLMLTLYCRPGYASMINFQIFEMPDSRLYTRFVFNSTALTFPWCTNTYSSDKSLCFIDDVIAYVSKFIPTTAECPGARTPVGFDAFVRTLQQHSTRNRPLLTTSFLSEATRIVGDFSHEAHGARMANLHAEESMKRDLAERLMNIN